jgi:hypothetical protein
MNTLSAHLSSTVAVLASAILLSSCGGSGAISDAPSAPSAVHPDHGKTWVSPDAKRTAQLVFTSDEANDDVDIFSLPGFKLKGTVTGFDEPQGMCSGTSGGSGNVWVANTGTEQMIELSRTGQKLATITDASGYPVSCAVDPKTGDLAVFNIFNFTGAGVIDLYSCPSCMPKVLTIPNFYYYYFGNYDPKGDLFVDGKNTSGTFLLGEVPAGDTTGAGVTITGGTIYFPGMVQWYAPGSYLAVGDQLCGDAETFCLYSVQISGSHGTITGKTTFSNPSGSEACTVSGELDPAAEKYLVATGCGVLGRWHYPAGGKPKNSIASNDFGVAISVKK